MVASTSVVFVACSNEDDIPSGTPADNVNKVFPNGIISSITRKASWGDTENFISDIVLDKNGHVSSIKYCKEPYEISYPSSDKVKVTTIDYYDDNDKPVYYSRTFNLGKNGYISGMTDNDSWGTFSFSLDYDNQGRIVTRTDTDSDSYGNSRSKTTITYNNDGDIIRVDMSSESIDDGEKSTETYSAIVEYTDETITKPIENKGGIMFYDEFFDIDFDEDLCLYYAGLLGKATAHLPISIRKTSKYVSPYDEYTYESTLKLSWTINNKGLASSLTLADEYETMTFNFNWR